MGRPLTGSKAQTTTGWTASVPVRRGDRHRIHRHVATELEADVWIAAQLDLLTAGLDADPDLVPAVTAQPSFATVDFTQAAWAWHKERYSLQHRADAEREADVARDLRLHVIPAFSDLLELDVTEARARVLGWTRMMAGYPSAVALPVKAKRNYARENVSGMLWILTEVLLHAQILGADVPMRTSGAGSAPAATVGITAMKPKGRAKRTASLVTFEAAAAAAANMHVIHQAVLWLMRVAGLRISEAYGIRLCSFIDDGEWGFLLIKAQGGRTFLMRGENEEVQEADHKESTKSEAGYRLIALPHLLTALLRIIIEAFHTDPVTGEIDLDARLIPTIRSAGGGAAGFRAALREAIVSGEDPEAFVIPHDLRKGFSTDLAWNPQLDHLLRRRAMGHRSGSDIFSSVYTLDDRLRDAMKPAALAINAEITASIGTLIVPTSKRPAYGATVSEEAVLYADAVLEGAGWLINSGGGEWIGAEEAAAILSMSTTATRRLLGSQISAIKGDNGVWLVRVDDVTDWRERHDGTSRVEDLAEATGRTYHQVYAAIGRLDLDLSTDPHSRELLLQPTDVQALVAEFDRLDRLDERAVPVALAAKELRTSHSTINYWLRSGRLEADPESDAYGRTFVTRRSIQDELDRRLR
jgi:hypothetical protein